MAKWIWSKALHVTALVTLLLKVKKVIKLKGLIIPFKNGTLVIGWMYREEQKPKALNKG